MAIFLLLLLLTIAAWLVWRRWKQTDPRFVAEQQKNASVQLMVWYRAILTLLQSQGYVPKGGETPEQFVERVIQAGSAPVQLEELARVVSVQQYSRSEPDKKALLMAQKTYQAMVQQMPRRAREKWHLQRMTHGLGNFTQIP